MVHFAAKNGNKPHLLTSNEFSQVINSFVVFNHSLLQVIGLRRTVNQLIAGSNPTAGVFPDKHFLYPCF